MALEVVYLVRHGKAQGAHPKGDRHRSLSDEGRARIGRMIPEAREKGLGADLVLSSPYPRALQTRDLFGELLTGAQNETSEDFTPDADPREACNELTVWANQGFRRIAVFSHNPLVTFLGDLLLIPGLVPNLEFHTPTILALGFDRGFGPRLGKPLWILHP